MIQESTLAERPLWIPAGVYPPEAGWNDRVVFIPAEASIQPGTFGAEIFWIPFFNGIIKSPEEMKAEAREMWEGVIWETGPEK